MTMVHSHLLQAIAEEHSADLRSDASPRPEPQRAKRRRRRGRVGKFLPTLPVMRPERSAP
jgi:hypothetical protein